MKHLLRSFFFSAPFLLCAILLTLATVLPAGPANAQAPVWTQIKPNTFSGHIHIVKFIDMPGALFDANGAPLVGFVSDGPEIFRTTDGGKNLNSWQLATIGSIPNPFFAGWVNDISFENPDTGVAIVQGNTNPAVHGVLITTDGGATWAFDANPNTPDSGNGIYWDALTNRIFVASLDKGFVYSPDFGASWTVIDTNKYYTGFAFTSKSRGVVSTMGSNPSGGLPSNYWKYTTNGGLNWDTSRMFYETWQPVAIPTTETYFAAAINVGGSAIMRSDNDGYSFIDVPTFPEGRDVLNDCMQGDGCSIFTASTDLPMGMWYSNNDGANWQTMQPPLMPGVAPNPPLDTRFYVSPTTIWSFTTNVLWYTPRVLTADIHVWPDTINFTNASCDIPTDTVIHIFGCNCSASPQLTGSTVTQSQPQDQLTVNTGTIPRAICSSTTAPLGNPDSVTISYQPAGPINDTGSVDLKFSENGVVHDTFLGVRGNGAIPSLSVPSQRIALYLPACGACVDTTITITNTGCVPITITATYTTSDNYCILHFDNLQQVTLTPGINPSQTFHIYFCPSLQSGSNLGSIQFQWTSDNGQTYHTTKLQEVVGLTTTTIQPSFRGFHIGFVPGHPLSCCYGEIPSDTTIYFINTTCDTLTLQQPNIFGSHNPNVFEFNTAKPPLVFPIKLAPGEPLPLGVHINCHAGGDSEKVEFTYTVATTGGDCNDVLMAKDTATLAFKSSSGVTVPTFKPSSVKFNGVSCCDSSQIRTLTINTGCVYDTLKNVTFSSGGGAFYLVQPITVPQTDHPDSSFTIQFGFLPSGGASSGSIKLTFSDGTVLTIPITGSCSNVAEAALSTDQLNFDTLLFCGPPKCDTVWIKNASCGSIKVGAIVPPGPANPAFTITPPSAGTALVRGDSVAMLICCDPTKSSAYGSITDNAVLAIDDANGNPASFDTVTLLAYIVAPIPADSITQLAAVTICDTDTLDESFTFANIGQCYTYVITGGSSPDGSKVTVTPVNATYPVRVGVGEKQIFDVHFDPKGAAQNLVGNITLTDSAGNNITVPYNITVIACNAQPPVLTLHDTNTEFITTNCTPLKRVFAIAASNGTVTVTSVTLTSGTQFTQSLSRSLPFTVSTTDTLYDTVTYSPDAGGPNAATLTVGNLPPLNVTGSVIGTLYNAKFGISTTSPLLDSPNVALNFTISLDSLIPDDIGMTNLTIVVNEPGGLLTMLPNSLTGMGSWQADASQPSSESSPWTIHLKYTGSTTPGQMIAGGSIASFKAYTAIGKVNTTSVSIGAPDIFNDTNFARCKMSAESDGSSIPIQILLSCSDSILVKALNGNLQTAVPYIEVIPNPAHKDGSAATLHFTSNVSAPMTVDVLNMLGNSVAQLSNGPVEKGDHTLSIPTNDMAEGAYFVRISVNGYTVVRKFVLEKE